MRKRENKMERMKDFFIAWDATHTRDWKPFIGFLNGFH